MKEQRYEFGFIGAGKLAGSVLRGLVLKNVCRADQIIVREPNAEAVYPLQHELGIAIAADNRALVSSADTIFLGVKPQMVLPVLRELGSAGEDKLVVSFAAGVRIQQMEAISPARIIRVMTNTPSAIGRAATGFAVGSRATAADRDLVFTLFSGLGVAIEIEENHIDTVTALAGSGPAFVYAVIEALAKGATRGGLDRDAALRLAAQTALGAAELALTSGKTPQELINMVVTPGGTTAAGLELMKQRATSDAISAAVEAAATRSREMAEQTSNSG
jgi:pyrroline-5-carboxylate reductase